MSDFNPWADAQPSRPADEQSGAQAPMPAAQPSAADPSPQQPGMQPSAAQAPQFGASAYPQPSAAGQPSAPAAYPQSGPLEQSGQQPGGAGQYALIQPNPTGGNNFAALFDFGFKKFATRSIVKISYVLTFLFALGVWLVPLFMLFMFGAVGAGVAGYSGSSSGGVMLVPAFMWLVLGWIPGLLLLIYARMICEFFVLQQQSAESLLKLESRMR